MEERFEIIDDQAKYENSVISFQSSIVLKVQELMRAARSVLADKAIVEIHNKLSKGGYGTIPASNTLWTQKGVDCEILSPNSSTWQKGKVRMKIVLEFCPDEPENEEIENPDQDSLDDIRKTL